MFDNIIGQDQVLLRLKEDLGGGSLPQSILFYGTDYSGKSSTALELSRVLGCEGTPAGNWGCQCRSCRVKRALVDSDTLLLGPRYFMQEIRGTCDVFLRVDETFSRFMLIRAVRRLLRRFDPVLWEGEEQKIKKAAGYVEEAGSMIVSIEPEGDVLDAPQREKLVRDLLQLCDKIINSVNLSHIPIHQIRNATFWAHTSGPGKVKTIILEGAETMLDGAMNALLKVLEEPPANVYFILVSSNRGAIMQTILSRVRQYGFSERDMDVSSRVLERIFRAESGKYASLKEYFHSFDFPLEGLKNETEAYLSAAMNNEGPGFDELPSVILKERNAFIPFLEILTGRLSALLYTAAGDTRLLSKVSAWNEQINRTRIQAETYNQNHLLLLERLFYCIRKSP